MTGVAMTGLQASTADSQNHNSGISHPDPGLKSAPEGVSNQTGDWKEFTPPGGEFTILMPGSPVHNTRSDEGVVIQFYTSLEGTSQYAASYFDVEKVDVIANPIEVIDAIKKAKTEALRGTLAEERDITVGSKEGREFVIRNPQEIGVRDMRMRIFIVGNRVFQIFVMGDNSALHSPEAEKFFDSIHVPGM
jgi:hypothetical protein